MTTLNKEELIALVKQTGAIEIDYTGGYESDWTFTPNEILNLATLIESKLSDAKPVEQSNKDCFVIETNQAICNRNVKGCGVHHVEQSGTVPSGWKLVPLNLPYDSNETQLRGVIVSYFNRSLSGECFLFDDFYTDMLNAAPTPPESE